MINKAVRKTMEKIVEQTLLFDFYGELLTEHQKRVYEDVVFNDLSFSEAAEEQGISRQGIHDLIKRCNRQLEEYEGKLHLVEKFLDIQTKVRQMRQEVKTASEESRMPDVQKSIRISDEILEEL